MSELDLVHLGYCSNNWIVAETDIDVKSICILMFMTMLLLLLLLVILASASVNRHIGFHLLSIHFLIRVTTDDVLVVR